MGQVAEHFEWYVPACGVAYRERQCYANVPPPQRTLVAALVAPDESTTLRRTHPAEESPRLYFELARLDERDGAALAAFASRHGFLGTPSFFQPPAPESGRYPDRIGEPVALWQQAIGELRAAVELAAAASERNREQLAKWITVHGGTAAYDRAEPRNHVFLSARAGGEEANPSIAAAIRKGGTVAAARFLLADLVTKKLENHATVGVFYDVANQALARRITYDSLLGFAWGQLAAEVTSSARRLRYCQRPRCGGIFLIDAKSRRGHGDYCAPACRQAVKRARARARALAADGASDAAIARKLGVAPAQAKTWTAGTRRPRRAASRRSAPVSARRNR